MRKSFVFWEVNTGTVDTVSDSSLILRSIIKNMSQMTVTLTASDLCSHHSVSVIFYFHDFSFFHLIIKCRPSTSTVVLCFRWEQRNVTNKTVVDSFFIMTVVLVCNIKIKHYSCKEVMCHFTGLLCIAWETSVV